MKCPSCGKNINTIKLLAESENFYQCRHCGSKLQLHGRTKAVVVPSLLCILPPIIFLWLLPSNLYFVVQVVAAICLYVAAAHFFISVSEIEKPSL
jgi:DNA-directed RNA polymerase subunit RPC12/RpoP